MTCRRCRALEALVVKLTAALARRNRAAQKRHQHCEKRWHVVSDLAAAPDLPAHGRWKVILARLKKLSPRRLARSPGGRPLSARALRDGFRRWEKRQSPQTPFSAPDRG